jgi:hypothetical protein
VREDGILHDFRPGGNPRAIRRIEYPSYQSVEIILNNIIKSLFEILKGVLLVIMGVSLFVGAVIVIEINTSNILQPGIVFDFLSFIVCLIVGIIMLRNVKKYNTKPEETRPGYYSNEQMKGKLVIGGYGLLIVSLILFTKLIIAVYKSRLFK